MTSPSWERKRNGLRNAAGEGSFLLPQDVEVTTRPTLTLIGECSLSSLVCWLGLGMRNVIGWG